MSKPIYVYEFYVMDFGWHMFMTIPEMVEKLSRNPEEYHLLKDFLSFCDKAQSSASKAPITRGYCTDIHVMPLIDNHEPSFALIWKGGRGGWCVIASQRPIDWIEKDPDISCNYKNIFNDS